jgi:hypothetical protein
MISHRDARILICEGYRRLFGHEPIRPVAQLIQAIGVLETNLGAGWSKHVWDQLKTKYGADSESSLYPTWGAITAGREWSGKTFEHKDSKPNPDGSSTWYVTSFRVHETAAEAAQDLAKIVCLAEPRGYPPRHKVVLPAALKGDVYGFSAALYDTGYYRGFGKTREDRIAGHHKAVTNALARICKALGEEPPSKIDADLYQAEALKSEQESRDWASLKARALEAQIDVLEIIRLDAMKDLTNSTDGEGQ